jgi:hypothetical protein
LVSLDGIALVLGGTFFSVLFTPTLLLLELFDMVVEFVEVLSLRRELLLELAETMRRDLSDGADKFMSVR